jgi:hypothetical protein
LDLDDMISEIVKSRRSHYPTEGSALALHCGVSIFPVWVSGAHPVASVEKTGEEVGGEEERWVEVDHAARKVRKASERAG